MSVSNYSVYGMFKIFTEFTEGHQYWRTDGLVGTGLM